MSKNNRLQFDFKVRGIHYKAEFATDRNCLMHTKHGVPYVTDWTLLCVYAVVGKIKKGDKFEDFLIPLGSGYATRHKDDKFDLEIARLAALENFESAGTLFWTEEVVNRIEDRISK